MLVTQITDHVDAALARFLQQYKSIPSQYTLELPITDEEFQVSALLGIMAALVDQCQGIENAAFGVDAGRQLYNGTTTPAVGVQLDNLGTLFKESRNGLSDGEYIAFLFGTIAEYFSDDTIGAVTNVVSYLFQTVIFMAFELFPAEMVFCIPNNSPLQASLYLSVANSIQNAMGGGIGLGFIAMYPAAPALTFQCAATLPALVTTGNTTVGSNQITGVASTTGISVGMPVQAFGFPQGTVIESIAGSTVTVSEDSTQALSEVGICFGGQVIGGGCSDVNDTESGGGLAYLIYNSISSPLQPVQGGDLIVTETGAILVTETGAEIIT